ncbi:MAG: hypothetical protein Kow0074_08910 [Candidatus Zixiibacteriota bacterium]
MRRSNWWVATVGIIALLAIMATGCSDDENGGTGPANALSPEDQFELIDQLFDLDADTTDEESALDLGVLSLGIGEIRGEFLDGIDESDFENFYIPGLSKAVPSQPLSASVSYAYSNGWWVIQVDSAFSGFGLTFEIHMIDSVRFEDASNSPQQIPDETTEQFIERTSFDLDMSGAFGGEAFDFDFDFATHVDIGGLNTNTATINGGTLGTLGGEFQSADTTATFTLTIQGTTTNGVVPDFMTGDGCPSSGEMDIDLGIDATVIANGLTQSAQGTWQIDVSISNGIATITYQSGNYTAMVTEDVCDDD